MVITNSEQLAEALAWLEKQEYVAYDTETDGLNPRKDKVIGFGISSSTHGYYLPIYTFSGQILARTEVGTMGAAQLILTKLKNKKLLMFNASFDARFTKNNFGIDLTPALHADVMLMAHTVDENRYSYQLKELGAEIYGQDVKKEKEEMQASIKKNGGTAKEYYKADTEILGRYCIQDTRLTYRLYSHFSKELEASGLQTFFYQDEVMPLYREVTIPMEEAGIALDLPLLQNSLSEIKADLAQLETKIQSAISEQLKSIFEPWFLNKDYPLVTWNTKKPSMWTKRFKSQIEAWRSENPDSYMFNLLSKHHLKKLFFDTLKETPLSRTPKGSPQVDEEFLELMAAKYTWCRDLITYNKLTKLKGTYIERFLDEHEDGIFYPSFQQHRTVSGRYASDIQQMPRPLNK